MAGTILIAVIVFGIWKTGEAVMPPSTSLKTEQTQTEREKLIEIVKKLERHEEDNLNFLKEIRNDLMGS